MKKKLDFLIIGAGLTGLTISYLLSDKDAKYKIIESRSRLGGRIFTKESEKGQRIEMGATWLGYKHKHLISLLKDLKLEVFDQAMGDRAIFEPISTSPPYLASLPPNNEPSLRIKGGSSALINALKNRIDDDHVSLNEKVTAIRLKSDHIEVVTDKSVYHANKVISTLPPYLAVNTIKFDPVLPEEFLKVAKETHTWMGESIKVAVSYETPFWRKDKKSATIFSNVGPVGEMYEHNDFEDSYFVLKGFMNGSYYSLTTEERKAKNILDHKCMSLKTMRRKFGEKMQILSIPIKVIFCLMITMDIGYTKTLTLKVDWFLEVQKRLLYFLGIWKGQFITRRI